MQNRHSCRLFQVGVAVRAQSLAEPSTAVTVRAEVDHSRRTISSPTQMHIGTFSFKEFPKVACDKGLVPDNEDRAPGKRR